MVGEVLRRRLGLRYDRAERHAGYTARDHRETSLRDFCEPFDRLFEARRVAGVEEPGDLVARQHSTGLEFLRGLPEVEVPHGSEGE